MVAEMEPRIREIAGELLDRVVPSGEIELVGDLATPLPVTIIAEILGVDPDRRDDFKRWSNAVVGGIGGTADDIAGRQRDREEFFAYFSEAIEERRRAPSDDLISAVLKAEEQDVALTPDEIASFTMLLLIAGNETTTNLIGNAMLALLDHPDQLDAVAGDPSLIPNMVEEALRYDSPVQFLLRATTAETEVGGTTIPAGSPVVPMFASANRDSARFPDADTFDITRNAQGHIAFGLGPHFCLGAPLARLEAKVAFEELFARAQRFERRSEEVDRIDSVLLRGLRSLPLTALPVTP
jgi:cytochrome P450